MGDNMQQSALESMEELCSIIDEGRWNDKFTKRYAQLLCENIISRLQAASSSIPRATAGKNHKIGERAQITNTSSSQLSITSSSSQLSSTSSSSQVRRTVIEKKNTEDFLSWRKYWSMNINKKKHRRRDYYECDHEGCPAKKLVDQIDDLGIFVRVCYMDNHNCKKRAIGDGSTGYSALAAPNALPISKHDQQDDGGSSTGSFNQQDDGGSSTGSFNQQDDGGSSTGSFNF